MSKWTKDEVELLRREYPNTRTDVLAMKLNRSYSATSQMARCLGLKKTQEYLSKMKSEVSPSRKYAIERAKQIREEISVVDLSYIAGLFDGEGSITICIKKDKHRVRNLLLEIQIANSNKEILDWVRELFKLGCVYKGNHARKQVYHYFLSQWRAVVFLQAILPYLRIKKDDVIKKMQRWLSQSAGREYVNESLGLGV